MCFYGNVTCTFSIYLFLYNFFFCPAGGIFIVKHIFHIYNTKDGHDTEIGFFFKLDLW